jgi:hypothetical protein
MVLPQERFSTKHKLAFLQAFGPSFGMGREHSWSFTFLHDSSPRMTRNFQDVFKTEFEQDYFDDIYTLLLNLI